MKNRDLRKSITIRTLETFVACLISHEQHAHRGLDLILVPPCRLFMPVE